MIVIGAGLSGLVIARCLADSGFSVDVFEKRSHIGGAVYDFVNEHGVVVHKYGPHIFHTNSEKVSEFIHRFSEWNIFKHKVLGRIDDVLCPIPFNLRSIEQCFEEERAEVFKRKLIDLVGLENTITIGELRGMDDEDMRVLADFIYENIFYQYTLKQWGRTPEELGGNVMSRVPVRVSYRDEYFEDSYQLMPRNGYTAFLENIADHGNIRVHLNCDADSRLRIKEGRVFFDGVEVEEPVVYTGCVDRLLEYKYGELPYRTLAFVFEEVKWPFQPTAVVNYPNVPEFTRISEFGHFYPDLIYEKSTIMREYPMAYRKDDEAHDPFYPISSEESSRIYTSYVQELEKSGKFFLAGRLGSYKYMNMDVAILEGLTLAERIAERG